jgi:cyanophycinase
MGTGRIVLVGGAEAGDVELGTWLMDLAGGTRVVGVATAAAFDAPEQAMVNLAAWLSPLGAEVEGIMALHRAEAEIEELAAKVAAADLVYLVDGSAMHLRTALKGTKILGALNSVLERDGLVVASGGAAVALCDPMVDPRGGAPTVGLGLVRDLAVVTHVGADPDDPSGEKLHRGLSLFGSEVPVVALAERATCMIDEHGVHLGGTATVYLAGEIAADHFGTP